MLNPCAFCRPCRYDTGQVVGTHKFSPSIEDLNDAEAQKALNLNGAAIYGTPYNKALEPP